MQPSTSRPQATVAQRPRMVMVFAAAFVAGGAAAVGVNSVLDVWRTQAKPIVESEPIFVALRSLPQGAPVTVWDVGLRSWPKAMLPATAIRAEDSFEGCVLRHPLREGQPLLSVQLMRLDGLAAPGNESTSFDLAAAANAFAAAPAAAPEADLWAPAATTPEPRPAPLKPTSTDVAPLVPDGREPAVPANTPPSPGQTVGDPTPADVAAPGAVEPALETEAEPVAGIPTPVVVQPQPEATPRTPSGDADRPPNEPTPADTAAPAAAPQTDPPLVSVMKQPADQDPVTPADAAAPAGPQRPKGSDGMVRYLVVPERIAREADTLFAAPATPTQQLVTPQPAAPVVPPASKDLDAGNATMATVMPRPEPEAAVAEAPQQAGPAEPQAAAPVARPTPPRTAGPTSPPLRPTTPGVQPRRSGEQPVAGRPKPTPRQSQAPARQPAAPARRGSIDTPRPWSDSPVTPEKPKRFGAVMSSITSGFEAMVGGAGRKQPAKPSDYDEAVATDDPQLLPAPLPR